MERLLLPFVKYHGTGNDFVVIDGVAGIGATATDTQYANWAKHIADRHFGIGCDQILLLRPAKVADCDVAMLVYNSDGSRAEMCGNGVRCAAKHWYDRVLRKSAAPVSKRIRFETLAGPIICDIMAGSDECDDTEVQVDMGKPAISTPDDYFNLPVQWNGCDSVPVTTISMGNPHCVVFTRDLPSSPSVQELPLHEIGKLIETHPHFPNRTNVEFVEAVDSNTVRMRVWERGSGETLSCGTGACAVGVASLYRKLVPAAGNKVNIVLPGGLLTVEWHGQQALKRGSASFVFEGMVPLPTACGS